MCLMDLRPCLGHTSNDNRETYFSSVVVVEIYYIHVMINKLRTDPNLITSVKVCF